MFNPERDFFNTSTQMIDYKIEYSWDDDRKVSLVIVADISTNEELILLCDELYELFSKDYDDLSFYFFQTRDDAVDYIYLRFVIKKQLEMAIENSNCKGHLLNNKLTGRFSPPELLKTYRQSKREERQ